MKRTLLTVFVALLALLAFGAFALAQDPPPAPDPQPVETLDNPTLGDISGDPQAYVGRTITVDGRITRLLNSQAFLLEGEGFFAGGRAIVINATGEPLDLNIAQDRSVRIVGTVEYLSRTGGTVPGGAVVPDADAPADQAVITEEPPQPTGEVLDADPVVTEDPAMMTEDPAMAATEDPAMMTEDPAMAATEGAPGMAMDGAGMFNVEALYSSYPFFEFDEIVIIRLDGTQDVLFRVGPGDLNDRPQRFTGQRLLLTGNVATLTEGGFTLDGGGLFGGAQVAVQSDQQVAEGTQVDVIGTMELQSAPTADGTTQVTPLVIAESVTPLQ